MDHLAALARRRRRWLLAAAAAAAAALGVYKLYHHPSVAARRRRLARLAGTVASLAEAAAASADAAAIVSSDLADFLRSDSDEIPTSLKQLSKVASSPEVNTSISTVSAALAAGVFNGYNRSTSASIPIPESDAATVAPLADRVLDKLFSASGQGFASALAGSFARHAVLAFYSVPSPPESSSSSTRWVDAVAGEPCRKAILDWVEVFVGTAVAVFIDKTIHINTYDQLFAGLTNPSHDTRVKELLVAVCNGAVETLVKTSHRVLSDANPEEILGNGKLDGNGRGGGRWADTVSSTLAVPRNRRFALDVTGRVTFETVRSFLEFVLWKMHDGARRGGDAVVERGRLVLSYMSVRSMVVAVICITLCLHILGVHASWHGVEV